MKVKIKFPLSLQKLTGNKSELECDGETVEEVYHNLNTRYPELCEILWDKNGTMNKFFTFYINGRIVKSLKTEKILLKATDQIFILQILAGG